MLLTRLSATLILILVVLSAKGQPGESFKLPDTWAKDFVITLSYHSSMSGGKTEVKFTYDSCVYFTRQSHDKKPRTYTNKITASDRAAILRKLAALNIDQVKSESGVHAVHDGWSQTICFGFHCLDGGTSAEMSEQDKNTFLDAYRYLEEFAGKKKK